MNFPIVDSPAGQAGLSVSVALCTHNGAVFLREQVRSICLQSRRPAEIVLSDDASTDDSVAVVRAAVAETKREAGGTDIGLRVFENSPPLRVTKNFEQAVRGSTGDLIALSDQDDVWREDRLARLVTEFERRPNLLLLHSDARLVGERGEDLGGTLFHALEVTPDELGRLHGGKAFDVFLRRNLVTGATAIFRRSLLEQAVPFPVEWVHDEWLAVVAAAIGEVDVVEDQLVDYRQHAGNQIGARRDTFHQKVRKAFASRGNTHALRALKAQLLLQRLLALQPLVPADKIDRLRGKLKHQQFRAALPPSRIARWGPVMREAMTGRYDQFGRGVRGVIRDLFEAV